jgi:hypothetical protein
MTCLLYWLTGFRGEDFKTFFPIRSYVKIMSAEGGHLGWRSGSPDTILKGGHPIIIPPKLVNCQKCVQWHRSRSKMAAVSGHGYNIRPMGKLFKSLLLWNQSANLKQTWHGWSLGSILSKLCRSVVQITILQKLEAQVSLYRSPDINKPS